MRTIIKKSMEAWCSAQNVQLTSYRRDCQLRKLTTVRWLHYIPVPENKSSQSCVSLIPFTTSSLTLRQVTILRFWKNSNFANLQKPVLPTISIQFQRIRSKFNKSLNLKLSKSIVTTTHSLPTSMNRGKKTKQSSNLWKAR